MYTFSFMEVDIFFLFIYVFSIVKFWYHVHIFVNVVA